MILEGFVGLSECFGGFPPLRLFSISLATFPLDLTKTRLQMQGEAALAKLGDGAMESAPYRGMMRTALGIVQEEGFLKLWQGVTPAIYRHVGISPSSNCFCYLVCHDSFSWSFASLNVC